ncbi:MAG: hypothetical protein KatS3mg105_5191 [Gemmatales bacterium]|nr:MAG: hypothetical protein KatS3mg105_5191 [Gemmatales bacterium]
MALGRKIFVEKMVCYSHLFFLFANIWELNYQKWLAHIRVDSDPHPSASHGCWLTNRERLPHLIGRFTPFAIPQVAEVARRNALAFRRKTSEMSPLGTPFDRKASCPRHGSEHLRDVLAHVASVFRYEVSRNGSR